MKPAPSNWTRFASAVYYQDANRAIEWLCDAFGFEVRLKVMDERGRIRHSELTYGGGLVIDDADAHCAHAAARGADIVAPLTTTDYGAEYWSDRTYGARDPEGHVWWIAQRLRG